MFRLILITMAVGFLSPAHGEVLKRWREGTEHTTKDFCSVALRYNTNAICNGKSLPRSQARGVKAQRLDCSSNSSSTLRKVGKIHKMREWLNELSLNDELGKQKAFEIRNEEKPFSWSGSIPYTVTERWEYYTCETVRKPKCGQYRDNYIEKYVDSITTDPNTGIQTKHYKKRTVYGAWKNSSCRDDVLQHGAMKCSDEAMTYKASYKRDPKWNPKAPGYHDLIPNKYDLLPGEQEIIQVSLRGGSNLGQGISFPSSDSPNYNEYDIRYSGSALNASCKQNAKRHLEATLTPVKRIMRKSPNAFTLPVDMAGDSIDPLIFAETENDKGDYVNDNPVYLRLSDVSAGIVEVTADNSSGDEFDEEERKEELALNKQHPFFKNTQMKLQLVEDIWFGESDHSAPVHISDAEAVQSINLSMSEYAEVANSEYWNIPLSEGDTNIYKRESGFLVNLFGLNDKFLKPGARYILRVSMYQKGMPFYFAKCDESTEETGQECTDDDEDVYSRPLDMAFRNRADVDKRDTYEKINNWTLIDALTRGGKCKDDEIGCEDSE